MKAAPSPPGGSPAPNSLEIHPLTPDRWKDFVALFGRNGACAGCWCMWWRLPAARWRAQRGPGNRRAMRRTVQAGDCPGLIAYSNGQPAGWCAVAPRGSLVRLESSRLLQPVDDRPVWSLPCFFVARPFRKQGLTTALIHAALEFARQQGATALEAYPIAARRPQADVFIYTGVLSTFLRAGFEVVARRSPTRPIVRREIAPGRLSRRA